MGSPALPAAGQPPNSGFKFLFSVAGPDVASRAGVPSPGPCTDTVHSLLGISPWKQVKPHHMHITCMGCRQHAEPRKIPSYAEPVCGAQILVAAARERMNFPLPFIPRVAGRPGATPLPLWLGEIWLCSPLSSFLGECGPVRDHLPPQRLFGNVPPSRVPRQFEKVKHLRGSEFLAAEGVGWVWEDPAIFVRIKYGLLAVRSSGCAPFFGVRRRSNAFPIPKERVAVQRRPPSDPWEWDEAGRIGERSEVSPAGRNLSALLLGSDLLTEGPKDVSAGPVLQSSQSVACAPSMQGLPFLLSVPQPSPFLPSI